MALAPAGRTLSRNFLAAESRVALPFIHSLLPDRVIPMRVWRGPFRDAHRHRSAALLAENADVALGRVDPVIDVGGNGGYSHLDVLPPYVARAECQNPRVGI